MSGCLARCISLSAVWFQASCLTSLSLVRWGRWCDQRQGGCEEFQPSGLLPYLSFSLPPRQLHRPPVSFQMCQVSPCSALHSCFLCLNTFPPDIHTSLSLLCTLWVSAQVSPFQRDHRPGKTTPYPWQPSPRAPSRCVIFLFLHCLQRLLPSPCTRMEATRGRFISFTVVSPDKTL